MAIKDAIPRLRSRIEEIQEQFELQALVARTVDPANRPLMRPEDSPEAPLERELQRLRSALVSAEEIIQKLPQYRQNS